MKKQAAKILAIGCALFSLLFFGGCGGSGSTNPSGTVDVDVTDAPALDYSHVYVTVKQAAFHISADAGHNTAGWLRFDLPSPVTVDLAQLVNGRMYADAANRSLFSGLVLPEGRYQQIRLYLASTEDATLAPSATALSLQYNNEVQLPGDSSHYPLRIPTPAEGIKLVPESPVVVTAGGSVRLALDFNLNNDVVKVSPNGLTEFILKPLLGYFDMDRVGAITGRVAFGNLSTSRFVIKAEQLKNPADPNNTSGGNYRIVRRATSVDKATGTFNLYPLPVFANNTTATYDILLRARNAQTSIVKKVTVHRGTSLTRGAANLGTITVNAGTEFKAQLPPAGMHPSGTWVNFYQTLTTDAVPYEVRCRHLNPYTGRFTDPIELSTAAIQVYDFSTGSLSGPTGDPTTVPGSFSAVADALLYTRGAGVAVSGAAGSTATFTPGGLTALPHANSITASVTIPAGLRLSLNKGHLFITNGGLIIDSYQVDQLIAAGGGTFSVPNPPGLPGGTAAKPFAGAYYGAYVLGWGGGRIAAGSQQHIDLTTGDGTADITLK
jgi:hypothetical protein